MVRTRWLWISGVYPTLSLRGREASENTSESKKLSTAQTKCGVYKLGWGRGMIGGVKNPKLKSLKLNQKYARQ